MAPPRKTHCPQGHEYTPANSYHHPTKGGRCCRECHRVQAREHARRKAAAKAQPLIVGRRDGEGRWEPAIHIPYNMAMRDRRLNTEQPRQPQPTAQRAQRPPMQFVKPE